MKNRFAVGIGGMLLAATWTLPAAAADKIQAFVSTTGKVVYTNQVDNTPLPLPSVPKAPKTAPAGTHAPIHALIDSIATNHGVDPDLVKAIVTTESNFNRWAVSNKGARGLMQLIPGTGARFGVRDFFDPKQNIEGGVRYMKFLLEKFNGDLDLSLAAYNAGENLVQRLGRIPAIPETRDYVRKVRSHYGKSASPRSEQAPIQSASAITPAAAIPKEPSSQIFRTVDDRGVVHFSNVAPPK
jgi:soluble lytic murein transglycosylase-like protein